MFRDYLSELNRSATLAALPRHDFCMLKNTTGKSIAACFEQSPSLPGIVILDTPEQPFLLSRKVFHEILGRPYGVDLFLNRPIETLITSIPTNRSTILPANTSIQKAAQTILDRDQENTYEPIIVKMDESSYSVIDAYDILATQNHLLHLFNEELDINQKISETLRTNSIELSKSLDADEVMDKIMDHLNSLVECAASVLLLKEADIFITKRTGGTSTETIQQIINRQELIIQRFLQHLSISEFTPLILQPEDNALLGIPLVEQSQLFGIILLEKSHARLFSQNEIFILQSYLNHAVSALQNARFHADIRKMAITDALTNVLNRRGFFTPAQQILGSLINTSAVTSAIMVDLDHFKSVNDQFGHTVGDVILQKISTIIQSTTRATDLVCRYGGDEFLILLPNTNLQAANSLARRILKQVDDFDFFYKTITINPKVSIGISSTNNIASDKDKEVLEKLIERVDYALYQAKLNGRHCIFTWEKEIAPVEMVPHVPEIDVLLESLTKTQAELQISKAMNREVASHLDVILENAGEAIILADTNNTIKMFNKSAQKIFRVDIETILDQDLSVLFPRQVGLLRRIADKPANEKERNHQFLSGRRTNGEEFPVELSLSQVDINDENYLILIASDITERVKIQQEIVEKNTALKDAYFQTILGWSQALELRDMETMGHSKRVTIITLVLAKKLGVPPEQWEDIQRGALLHDIGKMAIPDKILSKTGPLDESEWVVMRKHPTIGKNLLAHITFLQSAIDIPASHHEKWDGTGYPEGLKGKEIPLSARIFAIGDVWDALRSDRPYRKAMTEEEARKILKQGNCTHFDPQVYHAFIELLDASEFQFYDIPFSSQKMDHIQEAILQHTV